MMVNQPILKIFPKSFLINTLHVAPLDWQINLPNGNSNIFLVIRSHSFETASLAVFVLAFLVTVEI